MTTVAGESNLCLSGHHAGTFLAGKRSLFVGNLFLLGSRSSLRLFRDGLDGLAVAFIKIGGVEKHRVIVAGLWEDHDKDPSHKDCRGVRG